jgi:pilus assembly protein Flp/PilA
MRKLIAKFAREEDGAAMIEYTVLIGIITVAAIVSIGVVGTWVSGQWTALETKLVPPADGG